MMAGATNTHTVPGGGETCDVCHTMKLIVLSLCILQMNKWFLDPRRPVTGGPQEEGLMPYIPELRISPHDMITYNHTLPRVSAIYTAPTGLESACVVLVYGLG